MRIRQGKNGCSLNYAPCSTVPLGIVIGIKVGFYDTEGCGGMNEFDIIPSAHFRNNANVGDFLFSLACGKENKVAGLQVSDFHLLTLL